MSAVQAEMQEDAGTSAAAQTTPGLERLRLAGPLTAVTAPALRARIRQGVAEGRTRIEIDLQAVTALDAAGIAALLEARRVLEAQPSGTLALRANDVVCRALRDTGTIAAFALWTGPGM
jgi:ABC-type transporter Mla MlaB component